MSVRTWTLSILAVPVLYLVSEPPLYLALSEWSSARTTVTTSSGPGHWSGSWTVPWWLMALDRPYKRLEGAPVIGNPLYRYRVWWAEHYGDIF